MKLHVGLLSLGIQFCKMSLKTNYGNVAVLGSLPSSAVGSAVFLSGKTQALLEQCVLEEGGIEVKFKQTKKL